MVVRFIEIRDTGRGHEFGRAKNMYLDLGQKADWSRLKKRERGKETEQIHEDNYFNKFGYKMR